MRVGTVLCLHQYWDRYASKRPSAKTLIRARGDNIWHLDSSGNWCCVPGALHDERNRNRDLRGRQVLISSDFYYFGRDAIKIPKEFDCLIATTQGHKNTGDAGLIERFWKWVAVSTPKRGRSGLPFDFSECGVCDCNPKDWIEPLSASADASGN
jgi:hypothetical protein